MDLITKGQFDRAIRIIRETLQEFEHTEVRQILVLALGKAGRYDEAISLCREGMRRYPGESEWRQRLSTALHNYAVQLIDNKSYDRALGCFEESLTLTGDEVTRKMMAQCYALRALTKLNAGNRWGARQDLQESARLDPRDSTVRDLLRQIS